METFGAIMSFMAYAAVGFTAVEMYLMLNKLWKRKHMPEVAESISLVGKFVGLIPLTVFTLDFFLHRSWTGGINTGLILIAQIVTILVGAGLWVAGRQKVSLWKLILRNIRKESKEVGDLAVGLFKSTRAKQVIEILSTAALIDGHLDDKEKEFVQKFADNWNIPIDWKRFEDLHSEGTSSSIIRFRKIVKNYLHSSPPEAQVTQLAEIFNMLVKADKEVSPDEELIMGEFNGMINQYINKDHVATLYQVAVVPQNEKQEEAISNTLKDLKKEEINGGTAFVSEAFYSDKYADIVCAQYQELNFFAAVIRKEGEPEEEPAN